MNGAWPDSRIPAAGLTYQPLPADDRSRLEAKGWTAGDIDSVAPERQRVWVATVSDDEDSPGPAVYVADTEENLMKVIRKQQGIPDADDLLEWMEEFGKVAVWDWYYVSE